MRCAKSWQTPRRISSTSVTGVAIVVAPGASPSAIGVRFDTPAAALGPGTARCLIMVTADGQRTMATYLGACVELGPEDIDRGLIEAAEVTYLEGYLFDPPRAQEAFRAAAALAHRAGRQVMRHRVIHRARGAPGEEGVQRHHVAQPLLRPRAAQRRQAEPEPGDQHDDHRPSL